MTGRGGDVARRWGIGILALWVASVAPACDSGPAASPPAPMELEGRWQGMRLAEATSSYARSVGVTPETAGVVVAEVAQGPTSGGFWAGIQPGDVIVAVDGNDIASLTDLYGFAAGLDRVTPLPVQLLRRGQPMAATLTPAPAVLPIQPAGQLFCPTDRVSWTEAQVAPSYRCPRCGGALSR